MAAAKEKNCYVSLAAYVDRVEQVKAALAKEKGVHPTHVLATTDEHGEDFLAEVRALGWTMIDHEAEGTIDKHGLWSVRLLASISPREAHKSAFFFLRYPTLVDSVILSLGTGFVGTSGSTSSFSYPSFELHLYKSSRSLSLTVSILARRRVEDWNGGIGKQVNRLLFRTATRFFVDRLLDRNVRCRYPESMEVSSETIDRVLLVAQAGLLAYLWFIYLRVSN